MMIKRQQRIAILAAGRLDAFSAKTAAGIIRYRAAEVVGVINPEHAGERLDKFIGVGHGIPIVAGLSDLDGLKPDTLIIGVAPAGGRLPDAWRTHIRQAVDRGMNIVNGLHTMIGDDSEIAALAARRGVTIWDVRRPPQDLGVGTALARSIRAKTVLTVGSDCNIGKKITAIEIAAELQRRGYDAEFVPTGQTGVMIKGTGIAIDRVISDFVSGAVEKMVLENQDHEWIVIEGQGAIFHPSFSGVTLGLMHGACPRAMILCHQPGRNVHRNTEIPIPPLPDLVNIHELLMLPILNSRIVGVALNCLDLTDQEARDAIDQTRLQLQLPVTDVVRFGPRPLVDALLAYFDSGDAGCSIEEK